MLLRRTARSLTVVINQKKWKRDIVTGSVLEILLEKEYGFGYVKLIFSQNVQPEYFDNAIIKFYNIFRRGILNKEDFNKENFETDKLAMCPLIVSGFLNVRGEHKWIFKGLSDLTQEDKMIPGIFKCRNA